MFGRILNTTVEYKYVTLEKVYVRLWMNRLLPEECLDKEHFDKYHLLGSKNLLRKMIGELELWKDILKDNQCLESLVMALTINFQTVFKPEYNFFKTGHIAR